MSFKPQTFKIQLKLARINRTKTACITKSKSNFQSRTQQYCKFHFPTLNWKISVPKSVELTANTSSPTHRKPVIWNWLYCFRGNICSCRSSGGKAIRGKEASTHQYSLSTEVLPLNLSLYEAYPFCFAFSDASTCFYNFCSFHYQTFLNLARFMLFFYAATDALRLI